MNKALVLAGGKGLRLYSGAEELPKPMVLVNGRPILEYVVLMLKELEFQKIYIVVGYKKELIIDHFGNGKKLGLEINYLENPNIDHPQKSGLSDAVLLGKSIFKEPFMTILGDEIYVGTKHKEMIESSPECEAMIAVYETKNIEEVKKNYSVKIDANWNVLDLEEKPKNPWNNLVGCGTYLFRPSVFKYIEDTPFSPRSGRKEIADTLKMMVVDRKIVKAFSIGGRYLNINYQEDLVLAEKILQVT